MTKLPAKTILFLATTMLKSFGINIWDDLHTITRVTWKTLKNALYTAKKSLEYSVWKSLEVLLKNVNFILD